MRSRRRPFDDWLTPCNPMTATMRTTPTLTEGGKKDVGKTQPASQKRRCSAFVPLPVTVDQKSCEKEEAKNRDARASLVLCSWGREKRGGRGGGSRDAAPDPAGSKKGCHTSSDELRKRLERNGKRGEGKWLPVGEKQREKGEKWGPLGCTRKGGRGMKL